MNKMHTVLLGGIMALSLAACKTTGTESSSGSSMNKGNTGTSSPSGQSGTNTGTTNDVGSGTSSTQPPPVTNPPSSGAGS